MKKEGAAGMPEEVSGPQRQKPHRMDPTDGVKQQPTQRHPQGSCVEWCCQASKYLGKMPRERSFRMKPGPPLLQRGSHRSLRPRGYLRRRNEWAAARFAIHR